MKKALVELTVWMNLYPRRMDWSSYDTPEEAERWKSAGCFATVKMTGTYLPLTKRKMDQLTKRSEKSRAKTIAAVMKVLTVGTVKDGKVKMFR